MVSQVRHNFHDECEAALNKHINLELHLSYVFLSMSYHFDRDDVALPGFSNFFLKASEVEKCHAEKLMKYQNKRGGRLVLQSIQAPSVQEWGTAADTVKNALDLKKQVYQAMLELHEVASNKNDSHMGHFVDDHFIEEHVNKIKKLGRIMTQLKRVGTGQGLFLFDKEFVQSCECQNAS